MNLETITKLPKLSRETDKKYLCSFINLFKSFYKNESELIKSQIFENCVEENLKNNYRQVLENHLESLNGQNFNFENFIYNALKIFFHSTEEQRREIIIFDSSSYLSRINSVNLQVLNENSNLNKFHIVEDLQFSMINFLTGKCGSGKTRFLEQFFLYSNSEVLTLLRNSLISMNSEIITELDSFHQVEKQEIGIYQRWEHNNKDMLPPNVLFSDLDQTITNSEAYFNIKENSPLTYSNLFFLLQYVFNKALDNEFFLNNLNEYLKANEFQYTLVLKNNMFFIQHLGKFATISNLSKGESVKFYLLILEYVKQSFEMNNQIPKLPPSAFLLDEIDSNCDPTLIKKIVNGLNLLADFFKIQIFTATHNPATISFLDLKQLYRVEKEIVSDEIIISIRKAKSKGECIFGVTENILLINEPFKEIFVEGQVNDDKKFYEWILKKLNINKVQVFIHQLGGKSFSEFFRKHDPTHDQTNQMQNIFGIIDCDGLFLYPIERYHQLTNSEYSKALLKQVKDERSKFNKNLHIIDRYTLENYIYDPIYIYFVLKNEAIKNKKHPDLIFIKELRRCFELVFKKTMSNDTTFIFNKEIDEQTEEIDLEKQLKTYPTRFKKECQEIVSSFGVFMRNKINSSNDFKQVQPDLFKNGDKKKYFNEFKQWFYSDRSSLEKKDVEINAQISISYDPIILFHHGKNILKILNKEFPKINIFKDNQYMVDQISKINCFVFSDIRQIFNEICNANFYPTHAQNDN